MDLEKAERKQEKRNSKIMLRSIGAAGMGVGLFLLRFLVAPFLGENKEALAALGLFSLCLIGFGGVMIAVYIIKKDWLSKIYMLMIWVVLPILFLKLFIGS
ncbi:MAG: hypothetical protein CO093_09570 [Alphaproteobacteria bacterium CG_4_9_14_3_um_filter_47_13]|nr:MAG: hypothetical protein CO093_09570 [Alphaproteobacteria bacterium CG_4_9_14_3_um_filter_47_13]